MKSLFMRYRVWYWDTGTIPESDIANWFLYWLLKTWCRIATGHKAEDDQCRKPEHRFCLWCSKSMPHAEVE